ncbi:MAG: tetratricopeptide repeat protein [Aestuariivirgaceae bacterium]
MRMLRTFIVVGALAGLVGPAFADQTDPRLTGLFADLKVISGPAAAAPIERKIWTIWLETQDETVQALMKKGIERMGAGDLRTALAAFNHVVEAAPDFAEGWNKRATVYYLMEKFDESLADIITTLKLEPRHFGALSGRGLIYVRLEDLNKALTAFEAALAVNPQMIGPRSNVEAIRKILKQRDI